jgi:pimeloyl-ACP methyl ester carboxylesterase
MEASNPKPTGRDAAGAGMGRVASPPFPIEVALTDGTVLRGLEHAADGPPLVFVHDLGDDLDAWGSVASSVRSAGFRVICLELRGHGLSGGEPDPSATFGDLTGALREVAGAFGPVGLVTYGAVGRVAFSLGPDHGAPIHALISPAPRSGDASDGLDVPADGVPAMRVLFTGAHDHLTHDYVRNTHSSLRGQNMWISTGTVLRGPALLQEYSHLVEQLVMYMRRHLTAYHLAWIAEHGSAGQDSDQHESEQQDSAP